MIAPLLLISAMAMAQAPDAKPAIVGPSAHDIYCSQLAARNAEAETYRADPENQWNELSRLQTALLQHLEDEALKKRMSFEDYQKLVRERSKGMGQEIKLSEFHRSHYVTDLFNQICIPLEAAVSADKVTPRIGPPIQYFQPFDAKDLPSFKPFKVQDSNSAK